MDARQLVATPVATAVAAVSALIGLAPWLASGARLPVQNLWAKATAPDDMPLALLPISQYATTTIVALLLTGAALGGLTVRVLRKGMDGARGPLIGGAVGLSAVQLLAIGQSFWVVAEGHGLLDDTADPRAHLYVGALLAAALLTWLVALTVHALTASRRRGRVAFGLALSTVPFAAWLAAWATPFVHVEQGPGPLGVVMAWLPAVVVGGALGWAGFRRGDRWSWFWSLGVLWLLPPVLIACEAALGARNELGNWGAMLDTASMLFLATLDTSWHKVAVALGIALVVALVLHLTGRSGRRRSSSADPSARAATGA